MNGGGNIDFVSISGAVTGATFDLGGGNDKLILFNAAHNTLTVANIETLTGGTGDRRDCRLVRATPVVPSISAPATIL